jgi:hypothetical protein
VKAGRLDILQNVARNLNPAGRVFAALALYEHARPWSPEDITLIGEKVVQEARKGQGFGRMQEQRGVPAKFHTHRTCLCALESADRSESGLEGVAASGPRGPVRACVHSLLPWCSSEADHDDASETGAYGEVAVIV